MPSPDDTKAVSAAVAGIVREGIGLVGAGLVGVGGWMHYPPLGLMLGGGILVSLVVLSMLVSRR